jgi:peptide/nickel transport system permease protein
LIFPVPDPVGGTVAEVGLPMWSPGHVLGTDMNGNDNWSRLLYGGRASLGIALAVNLLGLVLGGCIGAFAACFGGWVDSAIMRFVDVLIAFPSLVLALAAAQILGPGYTNTIAALALFSVPAFARVARSSTLRLRSLPFMLAARLSGTPTSRVLFRHIAPNVLPQLATFALLGMGVVIVLEGGLSYLGLGVQAPDPSWGGMIYHGQQAMLTKPSLALLPSGLLFVTVLSFNLLGEALRVRWDER